MTISTPENNLARKTPHFFFVIYLLIAFLLSAVVVFSSPLRHFFNIEHYDRLLDVTAFIFLIVRTIEILNSRRSRLSFYPPMIFVGLFFAAAALNSTSEMYHQRLLLIEGKIVLFILCAWACAAGPILTPSQGKTLLIVLGLGFALSLPLFLIFPGGYVRLKTIDESNYTILFFTVVSLVIIKYFQFKQGSIYWFVVYLFLFLSCFIAQSRTGITIIIALFFFDLILGKKYFLTFTFLLIFIFSFIFLSEALTEKFLRGDNASDIDRVIFLREFLSWLARTDLTTALLGNHIGVFLSPQPIYMHWWVTRLADQQQIPFGLTGFAFHSGFLRIFSVFGFIPSLLTIVYIFSLVKFRTYAVILIPIFLASISMSVFHISAFLPFFIIVMIVGRNES